MSNRLIGLVFFCRVLDFEASCPFRKCVTLNVFSFLSGGHVSLGVYHVGPLWTWCGISLVIRDSFGLEERKFPDACRK